MDAVQTAQDWTQRRVAVPLAGSSARIALDPSFPGRVRLHALFVSKCTSANALEDLRQSILGVLAGDTTPAQAERMLRAKFAGDDAAGTLLSSGRARQIITQQAMMAYAVGERQVGMDPAVMAYFPNWKYVATKDDRVRDSHAALDGLVLPKTDPFWRTHTPPWEFGCRCSKVDAEANEATGDKAVTTDESDGGQSATVVREDGRVVNLTQSPSGFVFEPDAAFTQSDMGLVKDLKSRRQILDEMVKAASTSKDGWDFVAKPETEIGPPTWTKPESEIASDIARVVAGESASVGLGKLLPSHADGLGLSEAEHGVRFSAGAAHYGVEHWRQHHADTLPSATALLGKTLWQPGAEARLLVRQSKKRLMLWNRRENTLAIFLKHGSGWELQAVDAWAPGEKIRTDWMLR